MQFYLVIFVLLSVAPCFAETVIGKNNTEEFVTTTTLPLGLPAYKTETQAFPNQIAFGQFLFFSPLLSSDHTINCASCHVASQALSGPTPVAIGINKQTGHRHAPPLFNLYIFDKFMWDGRASSLTKQIHIPMESQTEMGIEWLDAVTAIKTARETQKLLPSMQIKHLDKDMVVSALAAYVRTLVSGDSPFDRYFYGNEQNAIGQDAKDGLKIFMYKAQCSTCHLLTGSSTPFTDNSFHSIGVGYVGLAYQDKGRYDVTDNKDDLGSFKTPTLRNVAQRKFFMHDGSMSSLREVIDYYNKGGNKDAPNLDTRMRPLFLNDKEIKQLIVFLDSLSAPIESYQAQ